MLTCAKCHQFSAFIDENRLCSRCARRTRQKIYELTVVGFGETEAIPYTRDKAILSKTEWISLRAKINKYYNTVSSEDIESYNAEIKKEGRGGRQRRLADNPGFIYLLSSSVGLYKLGRTIDMEKRFYNHERTWPIELKIVHTISVNQVIACETFLLRMFKDKQKQGEWFALNEDDVRWLKSLDTDELEGMVADAMGV